MGFSILRLDQSHDLKSFNCGTTSLDEWLQNISWQHQKKGISSTFILVEDGFPSTVVGYYSLAMRGLTSRDALPEPMKKALPLNVPALTLARLAVSRKYQKKRHGERLLLDAMDQAKTAASLIGGSFLFVDAKDTKLAEFYSRYGFIALPKNRLTLCIRIADIP